MSNKICDQKGFAHKKVLRIKKFCVKDVGFKTFLSEFGVQEYFESRKNFISKNFGLKKNWVQNLCLWKILAWKKNWIQKILRPNRIFVWKKCNEKTLKQKNLDPKNFDVYNNLDQYNCESKPKLVLYCQTLVLLGFLSFNWLHKGRSR